jgi:osmotically inducible protein OsmC
MGVPAALPGMAGCGVPRLRQVPKSRQFFGRLSKRALVKLNCSAIPSGLLESELFGHEKGAFTGAVDRKVGRFEVAHEGTLSSDGRLDVKLSTPGLPGDGTNPEQPFAAGWSACFLGALGVAARQMKVALPAGSAVDAEVDLLHQGGEYRLRARLNVRLPGLDPDVARSLLDLAHNTCPYSKATRGNIDVAINLVG